MIADAIKHKFHSGHDHGLHTPSHRHGSASGASANEPLLLTKNNKLAAYTEEELNEYRQVFNMFDTGASRKVVSCTFKIVLKMCKAIRLCRLCLYI
jgi:hypothetical protein